MVTQILDDGTLTVLDGPPWEAPTETVCTLTAENLTSGGFWIEDGRYLVADERTTFRAREPLPFLLRLRRPPSDASGKFPSDPSLGEYLDKMLGRYLVVIHQTDDAAEVLAETPYAQHQRVLEVLERLQIEVVETTRCSPTARKN